MLAYDLPACGDAACSRRSLGRRGLRSWASLVDIQVRFVTIARKRRRFTAFTNDGRADMRRLILFLPGLAAALVLVPTTAVADSATHSYVLVMEEANFGVAPNGDTIAIEGEADFSVNPKTVEGGGSFTHMNAAGAVLAT